MTTWAYSEGVLVVDSGVWSQGLLIHTGHAKFEFLEGGNAVAVYSGDLSGSERIMSWLRNGLPMSEYPELSENSGAEVAVITVEGALTIYHRDGHEVYQNVKTWAGGRGMEYALGYLATTGSAEGAVRNAVGRHLAAMPLARIVVGEAKANWIH